MDKEKVKAVMALLILCFIFFAGVIFTRGQVLSDIYTDVRLQYFYWRDYGFQALPNAIIPLWNPYILSGAPFSAGMQSALFYLPNILFLILPTHLAINYSIILHVFLAGLFTYLFLRYLRISEFGSLLSGVIFMFSSPLVLRVYAGHLSNLSTLIWLPLLLLFLEMCFRERKVAPAILGGITLSFQILAGHPQYLFYSSLFLLGYFLFRLMGTFHSHRKAGGPLRFTGLFLLLIIIGISLSAVQLVPAYEMVRQSVRSGTMNYEFASRFSFPPLNLITFLLPDFFGDGLKVPYLGRWYFWEMSAYIGILPLILCGLSLINRRNKYTLFFAGAAFLSLILTLGKYTPLFSFLYRFLPGFALFRGSSKFLFLTIFSLSLLAGGAADWITESHREEKSSQRINRALIAFFLPLVLILIFFYFRENLAFPLWKKAVWGHPASDEYYVFIPPQAEGYIFRETFKIVRVGFLRLAVLLLASLLTLHLCLKKETSLKLKKVLLLLFVFLNLWMFGNRYLVTFPVKDCYWSKDIVGFFNSDRQPYRIGTSYPPYLNQGMVHRIPSIGGYDANISRRYNEFINLSQGKPLDYPQLALQVKKYSPLLNLLNMKYLIATPQTDYPDLKLVFRNDEVKIYKNEHSLPRTFIVYKAKVITGRDNIFRELSSSTFDPREYVILEEEPRIPEVSLPPLSERNPSPKEESSSRITEYSPGRVIIEAELERPGYLILSDTYYPGWKVYVDGRKDKIYQAYYTLRAVFLKPGKHQVEFVYAPLSFRMGASISLLTLSILSVLALNYRLRR